MAKVCKGQHVKLDFLKMRMSLTHRVPSEQVLKVQSLEWSQTPGDKIAEATASTTRNDADFDIRVADANTSSSDDPSSRLSSIASVCWKGEKHVRRYQAVDAFRSDGVHIFEEEAQEMSSLLFEIGSVTSDCENL